MKYKILKRQFNSEKCLICGMNSDFSLRTQFYELENKELAAVFSVLEEHQSYPNRLHGGVTSAVLDETIGRAMMIDEADVWGVTVELTVKYKQPIPLDAPLLAIGRTIKNTRKIFEGTGELYLPGGEIAATAYGKYMKMPINKITGDPHNGEQWKVILSDPLPEFIEYGDEKNE